MASYLNSMVQLILYGNFLEGGLYLGETWLLYLCLRMTSDITLQVDKKKSKLTKKLATLFLVTSVLIKLFDLLFSSVWILSLSVSWIAFIIKPISYSLIFGITVFILRLSHPRLLLISYKKKNLGVIILTITFTAILLGSISYLLISESERVFIFFSLLVISSLNISCVLYAAFLFKPFAVRVELYKSVNLLVYTVGTSMLILFHELFLVSLLLFLISSSLSEIFYLTFVILNLLGYTTGMIMISFSFSVTYSYLKRGETI